MFSLRAYWTTTVAKVDKIPSRRDMWLKEKKTQLIEAMVRREL